MRKLREEFSKRTLHFKQLHKDTNVVIYQVSHPNSETQPWFEVFKYKTTTMCPMDKNYDPNEVVEAYPSDEHFGLWAWSCSNVESLAKVLRTKFDIRNEKLAHLLTKVDNYEGNGPKRRQISNATVNFESYAYDTTNP